MNAPERIAPEPGVYYGMSGEDYHAIEAMSASGAKKILRSPLHYKLQRDQPSEPTPSMQFGTAVHCGVLEPDRFDSLVIFPPKDAPKRPTSAQLNAKKPSPESLEAIAWWQNFNRDSIGKIVLSADDFDRARRCIDAVLAHPAAVALLEGGQRELSLFWNDARFGVPCKSRYDVMNHGGVVDLKTCQDASREAFARSIATYLYDVQAAFYISGAEHVMNASPRFFCFIAVESEPPFAVKPYCLGTASILAGQHRCNLALDRYAKALASGEWEGYGDTIDVIESPRWHLKFDQ